jgi:phosphoenolpyruvate carboxykinase (GTP)
MRMRRQMKEPPRIFHVNWFRKNDAGKFMWPGFGENMRVLKWIIDRCRGGAGAIEASLGWMPRPSDIDLDGLGMTAEQFQAIQAVDRESLRHEVLSQEELFLRLAPDLPKEMLMQRELLVSRM